MPGLQDWVNKWVRVNKSNIRFPDDDELDGQRHVKIRHVTSHPAPAAREQETSLDIHESIHRNSFSDAEIPSESSGALHDMILGRVSSKPNSSKPRSSYRRPPADDMSNSVTDNFYLNGYTNKQPKAKRFSSKLRRKESKKLLKLSRHGEAEELNRSLSSSIHSRKSNCEGKTRLKRTNSQSDLLKVRAVEIQQNRRLRVQHMQYQASYLARIEAFQQQNPDVIADSVGVPSEVDATISNGTYLYSRQSSNEHQCGSFSLASPNVSQSGWPQAPPPTPPQPIRPINPLLTGTSTIKPTVKSTSFLRRRNSVGRESVGTTSSSSSRGASRSRGSGGGTIASVAARMYLNHLASLENSVRLTPIIQGSPPGLDDALSGTSASVHPTCASPLFCEPCVSKDQQIQLLKQELARLKGSSQLSVSSTLDKAKPQDASFECCIDSTAMDPLNSATDAKTQNESFECCIDSNAIDPLNSITEAKTQNACFDLCIDSDAIDPLNSVSEAKTQNASFDLCIDSAEIDPLNSITEALHRHHQQLEQITEDRTLSERENHHQLAKAFHEQTSQEADTQIRNQDLDEVDRELSSVKSSRNDLRNSVQFLESKLFRFHEERDKLDLLRHQTENSHQLQLDDAYRALEVRDAMIEQLTKRLEASLQLLDKERKQQQRRRHIIFPATKHDSFR